MTPSLAGQTALVTGAARRVGRAIALCLAEEGATLAIHYHRSANEAASLVEEISHRGGRARGFAADLARPDGAQNLAEEVQAAMGRVDLLVNSASVWESTPIETLTVEELDRHLAVNLRSPFLLSTLLGRAMKRRGSGAIINILDWSVGRPYPDYLPYGVAKAGLAAATQGLARSLAPEVRVNAVAPGPVLLPEGMETERVEAIRKMIPLGRIGEPADVAEAVLYLSKASFVTGTVLVVDGGRSIR